MIFLLICIKHKGLWVPSVRSMLLCCLKQMRATCLWPYLKDDAWIIANSIIYPKRRFRKPRKYFWKLPFHSAVIGMELCAVPLLFGRVINVILMYCDTFVSENRRQCAESQWQLTSEPLGDGENSGYHGAQMTSKRVPKSPLKRFHCFTQVIIIMQSPRIQVIMFIILPFLRTVTVTDK